MLQKINKLVSKNNLVKLVLILYTLSIILDLHIFYNSISTLIRVGFISLIFLIIFIKYSNKKERKILFIYFIMVLFYSIIHFINASNYNNLVPTIYSNLSEALYIYKMIMNILIIYIVYKLNINQKDFAKYLKISLWFISGSIVFCNILKLGYATYSFNPIKANIFSWFTSDENKFNVISGKGYFHLGNQIIAIILLYYPLLLNDIKESFKKKDILLSIIVLLSMLILGNRLSTIGPLIILVLSFLLHLFLVKIKSEAFNIRFFAFLLISIIIYNIFLFHSPLLERKSYQDDKLDRSLITLEKEDQSASVDEIVKADKDLEQRFKDKLVNMNFPLRYYKYENDPEFWENMLTKSPVVLTNTRFIEISVIERVKSLNDNELDDWFGIGYDRVINVFNIERDYVMQYYSVGIIGTILLLGIYFIVYIYSLFKVLFNLEKKLTFKNIMLLFSTGIFLTAAYFSGNLFNAISTIIPLSFVLGILLNEVRKKEKTENNILGFNVSSLSKEEIIQELSKDIKNNKQNIIFNVNPIIISNFYNNQKVIDEFNKEKYQIPDGVGIVFASKMKDGAIKNRIPGIEFFEEVCNLASKKKLKVFLYGGIDGVAEQAKEYLKEDYKNIKAINTINGFVSEKQALKEIIAFKPDILFVALGSPKQEEFIINNKLKLKNIKVIMPVGGTLDIISGNVKRAPEAFMKLNLEWLYRMIKEPRRIKVNKSLLTFIFMVIFRNNCYNKRRVKLNDK